MPYVVRAPGQSDFDFTSADDSGADYAERYPEGVDLRPGSEMHRKIVSAVMGRATESHSVMRKRYDGWDKINMSLTAYVPLSQEEELVKEKDSRKPVSIVIPISYATLETLLTYFVASFLDYPIFRYSPTEPDDIVKAALLEHHILRQTIIGRMGLSLHTMWRDSFVYGFGVCAPRFVREYSYRRVKRTESFWSELLRKFTTTTEVESRERVIRYEGNVLDNIDPYMCFPDVSVSIHDVQKMEYFGYVEQTNYVALLDAERDDTDYFNVKFLSKSKQWKSTLGRAGKSYSKYDMDSRFLSESRPVDVMWMFIRLIPEVWGLGEGENPEWWKFGVAGDSLVIYARPLELDHDMLPVVVCAPEFDGHTATPISRLETIYPLHEAIDWFVSSHIANVRKALNDMIVVDPLAININDLKDPGAGKIIRMRRAAWGRDVRGSIMQLNVSDVTRGHIADAMFLMDVSQRASGATDILQGIRRKTSERVTASEVRGEQMAALSRLQRAAKVASMQSMYDLAYMIASQTIQLMSVPVWVGVIGRYEDVLLKEYPSGRAKVEKDDINIDFDIVPHDGSAPGGEDVSVMAQMFQVIASNPELHQAFDIVRMFKHIARAAGFRDVHEFAASPVGVNPSVVPNEVVEKGVSQGNLIPVEELGKGG